MIEIILVLLVTSVLFFIFSSVFQVKNQDVLYGQTCIENIYGNLNTFIDGATRGKSLQISGNIAVYPDIYYIDINPVANTIELNYKEGSGGILPYNAFELTGTLSASYNCQTANYDIVLSGPNLAVTINKGLAQNTNFQSFILSGGGFIGSVDVLQCKRSVCKQIGQLIVDTRTQSIQKKLCLTLSGSECTEWDR